VEGRGAIDYSPLSKQSFVADLQELNPTGERSQDYQLLQKLIDTKSYHFRIVSRGDVEGGKVEKTLEVVVYRTILGSKVSLRILSWRELDEVGRDRS
jgi:hypothetical protein